MLKEVYLTRQCTTKPRLLQMLNFDDRDKLPVHYARFSQIPLRFDQTLVEMIISYIDHHGHRLLHLHTLLPQDSHTLQEE